VEARQGESGGRREGIKKLVAKEQEVYFSARDTSEIHQ
jgi:hypothetical protein